jgi:two-component system sensor histidine kinase KdpD
VIEEEAERLSRFVSDLLDLSRIRAGGAQVDPQLYAAEDLVGAALERVRGLPGGADVRVTMPPGGEIPVGRFDFVQALCSLVNLTENALRHSPPGVGIDLEVSRRADDLVFEVMDRGPGIAEEDRARVFEAFYRGSGSRGAGTGLGLTIAREAARLQGGSVDFRPRPGGGSIFVLRLPAEDVQGLS